MGHFIGIAGPVAAGKSTLARALQVRLSRKGDLWLVSELDTFARGLSPHWIALGEHRGRFAEQGFTYARQEDGSVALGLGADARRVLAAFHRSAASIARSGPNVICETIVHDAEDWADWTQALDKVAAFWVKVTAPLQLLEDRERTGRPPALWGLARGMSARLPVGDFAVKADTASETTDEIVNRIVAVLGPSFAGL